MSLPSTIRFFDLYGSEIGERQFVNCGWWDTPNTIIRCFDDLIFRDKDLFVKNLKESYSCFLYGCHFFSEMVLDYLKSERPSRIEFIKAFEKYCTDSMKIEKTSSV